MIYLNLFLTFLKIGAFTFGGGYAMLPMIQSEVEAQGWLTEEQLINFIAVSESTPGPFAVNISTYVGMTAGGIFGALCATLGVIIPSFIVILAAAKFYDKFRKSTVINGCMSGLKPAVVGLIGAALISVGTSVFFPLGIDLSVFSSPEFIISAIIFAAAAVCAFKKVHPIAIILFSAVIGIASGFLFL